jgi:hypothetical protein
MDVDNADAAFLKFMNLLDVRRRVGAEWPLLRDPVLRRPGVRLPLNFGRIPCAVQGLEGLRPKPLQFGGLACLGVSADDDILLVQHRHIAQVLADGVRGILPLRLVLSDRSGHFAMHRLRLPRSVPHPIRHPGRYGREPDGSEKRKLPPPRPGNSAGSDRSQSFPPRPDERASSAHPW